mmetsp:Transcript_31208/g.78030  ORF Transcript_31208/g.78030 Transcript_31208/m.78030 type:complete len:250 (+) Transcript_31208:56-805(+)
MLLRRRLLQRRRLLLLSRVYLLRLLLTRISRGGKGRLLPPTTIAAWRAVTRRRDSVPLLRSVSGRRAVGVRWRWLRMPRTEAAGACASIDPARRAADEPGRRCLHWSLLHLHRPLLNRRIHWSHRRINGSLLHQGALHLHWPLFHRPLFEARTRPWLVARTLPWIVNRTLPRLEARARPLFKTLFVAWARALFEAGTWPLVHRSFHRHMLVLVAWPGVHWQLALQGTFHGRPVHLSLGRRPFHRRRSVH